MITKLVGKWVSSIEWCRLCVMLSQVKEVRKPASAYNMESVLSSQFTMIPLEVNYKSLGFQS